MTEAQFQRRVIRFLAEQRIWHVKVWGGGMQRAGIPDILACVNGWFVAIELKTEIGRTSPLQDYNLDGIRKSNGHALVLRPSGFDDFKKWINREVSGPHD